MSFTAAHESKLARRVCQRCHQRKARFQYRGRVRADRDHVLCFECYRSQREHHRARLLSQAPSTHALTSPVFHRGRRLLDAEIVHRRQMLAHLVTSSRR